MTTPSKETGSAGQHQASPLLQEIIDAGVPVADDDLGYVETFLDTKIGPYAPTLRQIGRPLAELAVREELHELRTVSALARLLSDQLGR